MDMASLMKQAQQFQEKMAETQQELASKEVSGTAGGGMVRATVTGAGELKNITVEQALINPDDVQMLQDLIVAAVNDGLQKAKGLGADEMKKLTGGMNIPGLF